MELSINERKVLLALSKLRRAEIGDVAREAGMSVDAATQSCYMLHSRGLVRVEEVPYKVYVLTEEGENACEHGLPERKILKHVLMGESSLAELGKKFGEEASIGIGWLKRKGWCEIREERLIPLVESPPLGEDEIALLSVKEGKQIPEHIASQLVRRKLLDVVERVRRGVELTPQGEELCSRGITLEEEITQITPELLRTGGWRLKKIREYDVRIPSERFFVAKRNPYLRLVERMRRILLEMGFKEIRDEIVQSAFWNFDVLFQPQDHPARDMQDTFYVEGEELLPRELVRRVKEVHEHGKGAGSTGWGYKWDVSMARKMVLRTHTTTLTIRYLARNPDPPAKVFCIGRVYRREAIDATHLPEFDQLEGIVMDRGASFRNLLGCLSEFYRKMGFPQIRFRPGYFPYTEPSLEVEVLFNGKWIELGGAGIFRREVTAPIGVKHPVLAWGLGVGRLAMMKLGLKDLRELYSPDLGWIRDFPLIKTE